MKVKIPRTVAAAVKELEGVSELLIATEWKKAALLAAVVRLPGSGAHSRSLKRDTAFQHPDEFAARGLATLRSPNTVRLYVQRWLDANDGEYPELGKSVTLPDDEWPPTRTGTDGYESDSGMERTIERMVDKHGAKAVAKAVVSNENVDLAVSQVRLDRVSTPGQRQGLVDRGRASQEKLDRWEGESRAGLGDHTDHLAADEAATALRFLRRAVRAKEQFPHFTDSQRKRLNEITAECQILLALLQGDSWSDADREFLASLGGDG